MTADDSPHHPLNCHWRPVRPEGSIGWVCWRRSDAATRARADPRGGLRHRPQRSRVLGLVFPPTGVLHRPPGAIASTRLHFAVLCDSQHPVESTRSPHGGTNSGIPPADCTKTGSTLAKGLELFVRSFAQERFEFAGRLVRSG